MTDDARVTFTAGDLCGEFLFLQLQTTAQVNIKILNENQKQRSPGSVCVFLLSSSSEIESWAICACEAYFLEEERGTFFRHNGCCYSRGLLSYLSFCHCTWCLSL